jgi:chromosome segregation ATPase
MSAKKSFEELNEQFNTLDKEVESIKKSYNEDSARLEIQKTDIQNRVGELAKSGISISNKAEAIKQRDEATESLSMALDSVENAINALKTK